MPTPMSVEIVSRPNSTTVKVTGDVDIDSKARLEAAMLQPGVAPRNLILDLSGVTFIDSLGLRLLLEVHHGCQMRSGSLLVAAPSDAVRRVFELTKLDEVLTVIDS